jgi:tellurite resistance protein
MRYNGGLLGGVVPALLMADMGGGEFDGAHLVSNFEMLNPSRNFFGKYYDLFSDVDQKRQSFLEFEKWWGGFHFTNEAEIRWIIEQLFVGNKLARGEAELEPGRKLDLKSIRSPIIVFASRGDNITPPQQALNWIVDSFVDENEIRVRGQRVIYMVHDKVGHLGIFVSSSIARKEHNQMASVLKTIEALAPGLYEMVIDETEGDEGNEHFYVSFHERSLQDILSTVVNDRDQERDFAAVARFSEMGAQLYEKTMRPVLQSVVTPEVAAMVRDSHPSRVSRRMFSDSNPATSLLEPLVEWSGTQRQKASPDNPWLAMERIMANGLMQSIDLIRDLRDASYENSFLALYGTPWMHFLGQADAVDATKKDPDRLRKSPEVQKALATIERGDLAAAVIRMLVMLADTRGSVRRDRLERSAQVLNDTEPFGSMGADRRAELIQQQSIISEFEPTRALATLPLLVKTTEERTRALELVNFIVGARGEMEPNSLQLIEQFEAALGMPLAQPLIQPLVAKKAATKTTAAKKVAAKSTAAKKVASKVASKVRR